MKKILKIFVIVSILFIAAIVLIAGITTCQFNLYEPEPLSWEVNPDDLVYFQESYSDCRNQFIVQAKKLNREFNGVEIASLKISSKTDRNLTIDYCYVPAQEKSEKLMILSSAVHGVEGFVGSAIEQMFMNELIGKKNMKNMGVLIIHGINPYGFKYKRRVTENNVDLNRNSLSDSNYSDFNNPGYMELNRWLNPGNSVNLLSPEHLFFQLSTIKNIISYSMSALRQATLQGQYQNKKGIIYGGNSLEPSIKAVTTLIQNRAQPYKMVFNIDLHSGYGTNGTLHLFPNPPEDADKKAKVEKIFQGYHIDWGDSDDFYIINGYFPAYIGEILPDKYYLTMTFEFGTLDTLTTMGSIKALHNMVIENQGFFNGYKSEKDEREVKSRFLESYYPSSETWRSKAVSDGRIILIQAIDKYLHTEE